MKNVAILASALLLIVSLSACASKMDDMSPKVKCPACGYEFTAPTE